MNVEGWVALGTVLASVFVAVIGYRQATKVADRNGRTEDRRVDVDEWRGILGELRGELNRVKSEREGQDARIDRMTERLDELELERDRLQGRVRGLSTWAVEVSRVLERPEILTVLQSHGIHIQPPPLND